MSFLKLDLKFPTMTELIKKWRYQHPSSQLADKDIGDMMAHIIIREIMDKMEWDLELIKENRKN
jgi:hypothetical protein